MNGCLDQEVVRRFVAGGCSPQERWAVETHLEGCETCRRTVVALRGKISNHDSLEVRPTHPIDDAPTVSTVDVVPAVGGGLPRGRSMTSLFTGYEIIEALPQGGQAVVYKATHLATRTTVAIKVLLPTLLGSARARHYFEREAELIAALDHPNIVRIRDSGILHNQYFFVMEYIEGEPLNRYTTVHKLSVRDRVQLFTKICSAVGYAHQRGVIHRDLKFGNILVDLYGQPHILDFGVAKVIGMGEQAAEKSLATVTGQLAGTLSTMSPEQAAGKPDEIDVRTDVYSLGVILYHLLTGQYPYDITGSTMETIRNIQEADPVRPRRLDRRFDSDLEAILLMALAKRKDNRYASAADLLLDLENWLDGRPIRVRSVSTVYLLRKVISRHRYTTSVLALLAVILATFGYVSVFMYRRAVDARRNADIIAAQWKAEAEKTPVLYRGLTFTSFLEAWRAGWLREAETIVPYFAEGSKEQQVAMFLLDPAPAHDKDEELLQRLRPEDQWFGEFAIGEAYYQAAERVRALQAFQRSFRAIGDLEMRNIVVEKWIKTYVRARLYELSRLPDPNDKPGTNTGAG